MKTNWKQYLFLRLWKPAQGANLFVANLLKRISMQLEIIISPIKQIIIQKVQIINKFLYLISLSNMEFKEFVTYDLLCNFCQGMAPGMNPGSSKSAIAITSSRFKPSYLGSPWPSD